MHVTNSRFLCLKTGLFSFDVSLAAGFLPPPPPLFDRCVRCLDAIHSILYLVKLVFSESTVGGAGVSCFVLFFFIFLCVLLAFSLLLSSTPPPPPRCLCTLCCSTAVSWWNLRYLIWSTCCPVLPDSMRKMFFCQFIFILYSALCRDSHFTFFLCIVLFCFVFLFFFILGDNRYFFIYIFCDFFVCLFLFVLFISPGW